jgi:K+-sensing histidine kinase KdpD
MSVIRRMARDWREYLSVCLIVLLVTAIGLAIPQLTPDSDGLLYLLAIILMSLKVGRWPMLFAALASAVVWEYIFVEPRWNFALASIQDILLVCIFVVVALIAGQFVDRIRVQAQTERLQKESERLHRTLLESVSHELRTPLAVMASAIENVEGSPAVVAEMQTALTRLNRLVGNLLDQSRLESGSLRPRMDWCDATDIINETMGGVTDALVGRKVSVQVHDELGPIRADFALTEHALSNLVLNAARHTPPGTPVTIEAGLTPDLSQAFLRVTDFGLGLDPALRQQLFQKFSRGNSARPGGLGLGLSICRGFMSAQGGDVAWAENPAGGSVFTIYLPHASPQPEPSA